MPLQDRRAWLLDDPCPGIDLSEIAPVSLRTEALILRSPSPLLHTNFVQIMGAASILAGIEYHYSNFIDLVRQLPSLPGRRFDTVRHEAIAWVNRVGQLHYFCTSPLVRQHLANADTPAIDSVLPFRDKHSAHRSIDAPRREDTPHLQMVHAMMLSDLSGSLWTPRHDGAHQSEQPLCTTHYAAFQIQLPEGKYKNLVIELEHQQIMLEGYSVIQSLLEAAE